MKKQHKATGLYILFLLFPVLAGQVPLAAQEPTEKESIKKIVSLGYYNENNTMQYLLLKAMTRSSAGVLPQKNKKFALYLDEKDPVNLVANIETDGEGMAKAFIPPGLKTRWDSTASHVFLAVADEGTDEEQNQETTITKAKISIDTLNEEGTRSITVRVMKSANNEWVPVPDVEVKVGMKRLGGILSGGDELSYTTDETGTVKVEYTKENIPGDAKGNIILAAKVTDNDELGNLLTEKTVGWGVPTHADDHFFDQRTLWTTSNRTPAWLLLIAYSIVIGVWGTLIYLLIQLVKIKKLSKAAS